MTTNTDQVYYALQDGDGNLIGTDAASGGYPWVPNTIMGVWFALTPDQMKKYMSGRYKLVRVKLQVIEEVKD